MWSIRLLNYSHCCGAFLHPRLGGSVLGVRTPPQESKFPWLNINLMDEHGQRHDIENGLICRHVQEDLGYIPQDCHGKWWKMRKMGTKPLELRLRVLYFKIRLYFQGGKRMWGWSSKWPSDMLYWYLMVSSQVQSSISLADQLTTPWYPQFYTHCVYGNLTHVTWP